MTNKKDKKEKLGNRDIGTMKTKEEVLKRG